jgi:uncharacterized HAD superfamily protein
MSDLSIPYPTLGIDLDGTITDSRLFFHVLSHKWPGRVIVVTYRDDMEATVEDLAKLYIRYDEVVLASDVDKSAIIKEYGIDVYIDDQDEMLQNIPEEVTVLKMRNGGNFDYDDKKWLYSDKTGKEL